MFYVERGTVQAFHVKRPDVSRKLVFSRENVVSHQTGSGIGHSPCFTVKTKELFRSFTWNELISDLSYCSSRGFAFSRETHKFRSRTSELGCFHVKRGFLRR
jgi:hypothetical protein